MHLCTKMINYIPTGRHIKYKVYSVPAGSVIKNRVLQVSYNILFICAHGKVN